MEVRGPLSDKTERIDQSKLSDHLAIINGKSYKITQFQDSLILLPN